MAALHRLVGLGPPEMDRAEMEARSGVESERGLRWWRALGFPEVDGDAQVFSADDVAMVTRLHMLESMGLIGDEDVLRLARLNGAVFSRLAEAQVATVDDILASMPGTSPSDTPRDRLRAFVRAGDTDMLGVFEQAMLYVWRRHLLAAVGRWLQESTDAAEAAVGFGDLARFTRLSGRLDPEELATLVDTFEAVSFDVVAGAGARVVKLIGDEVMFVAPDLDVAVDVGLELIERLNRIEAMPALRCGIAVGPTVDVGGDVFGPTVNLAARLTDVARPGAVMVPTTDAADLAQRADLLVKAIRRRYDLEGIGKVSVSVVRRAPGDDPSQAT